MKKDEPHVRVPEFAVRTHYRESTIRKKLLRREIGFRKIGRLILIPLSEVDRLMGAYQPPTDAVSLRSRAGASE